MTIAHEPNPPEEVLQKKVDRPLLWLRRAAVTGLAVFALGACASTRESVTAKQEYEAYGQKWQYYTVERYTKDWGLGSTHGVFGMRERLDQLVYLTAPDGETIPVHDRIFAVQRDGSLKKVECCETALTQASVYNFDNELIVYFKQSRSKTTDCLIFPEGHPEQVDTHPDRGPHVQLFGEFDPKSRTFVVRHFLPGFSREAFKEKVGARGSIQQTHEFFYENRKPFICK